jgi:hypothetical protein
MLPKPRELFPFKYWLRSVTIPAKTGEDTDVPPNIEQGAVPARHALSMLEIPPEHVLPEPVPPRALCWVQTK